MSNEYSKDIAIIANRITALREICEFSAEEMAEATGKTVEEYIEYEGGQKDFSFGFLYNCAKKFGVDITDILTGEGAKLSMFSVVRNGQGLKMERRKEYKYEHLAPIFKNKKMEPFRVTVDPSDVNAATHKKSHDGHELNYILEGSMTVYIGEEKVTLHPGDVLYMNAKNPHAMQAENGEQCVFLAIIAD